MSPLLLLALTACMEDYALEAADNAYDSGGDTAGVGFSETELRIDVYPPASLGEDAPPEQSHTFTLDGEPVVVNLQDAVVVSGVLSGYLATPTSFVSVPGELGPVLGSVQATQKNSVVSRRMVTDEDGVFGGELIRGGDYTVAWIPDAPSLLPFVVRTELSISADMDLSLELDYGAPIYGRVTHEGGVPLAGVAIRAVEPETGLAGPTVTTDDDGRYMLRVLPGSYTLEVTGPTLRILPDRDIAVVVEDDTGLRQDISYGSLRTVPIRGLVQDSAGNPVENVLVRLTSVSLDNLAEGTLVMEFDTASNGIFADDVPPGRYEVEYIPSYANSQDADSPGPVLLSEPVEVAGPSAQLPPVTLADRPSVSAIVVDAGGKAMAGTRVRARERDFDGYVFETVTDNDGHFTLAVSDADLEWSLEPPTQSGSAITRFDARPNELGDTLTLDEGIEVAGTLVWQDRPVPYAALEIRDGLGRVYGSTLTDESGAFSLRVSIPLPR